MANFVESLGNKLSNFGSRFNATSPFNISQGARPFDFSSHYLINKPSWVSLSNATDLELAARKNSIVKSCINILSKSAANARKVAVDVNTDEIIPWTDKRTGIQEAYNLLISRPNPVESAKEFRTRGMSYLKIFGNNYVRVLMPMGFDSEIDLLNVDALYNLPSQQVHVNTTGKIYDQTKLEDIVSDYALDGRTETFKPHEILHFTESNISEEFPSIMGVSELESLKEAIESTTLAMMAGTNLLENGGFQGIVSPAKLDATGATMRITPEEKEEADEKAREYYGLQRNQSKLWFAPYPMDFLNTALNATELGIYNAISNGAIQIANVLGVPYELVKSDLAGTTYENQYQADKRLYQNTTIPDVEDYDKYWSFRMNTIKYGFRIESRWNHIAALQDGFKDKAIALNQNTKSAELSWASNSITINQYLKLIEQPSLIGSDGDLYKVDWDKKLGITIESNNTNDSNIEE